MPRLRSRPPVAILTTGFGATYVPDVASGIGRLLFVRDSTLFAQPFDAGRLQLSGDAVRVAEPVGSFLDGAFFSASTNGVLVFRGPDEDRQLTWFDRGGKILGPASEPGRYSGLTLGPSETRAVVVKQADQATADQDLWVMELSQSRSSRLTFDSRLEESPVWSARWQTGLLHGHRDGRIPLRTVAERNRSRAAPAPERGAQGSDQRVIRWAFSAVHRP